MLSVCHASWNQHSRWSILGASVVYGNISGGRGSTILPGASLVAKSENSDGRSTPEKRISGPCEGWSLIWNGSTSKCRPLCYTQSASESECLLDRNVGNCSWYFVVLASRSLVSMRSWITINQAALSSSDDHSTCRFPQTLDHGVAGCCFMVRTSRAPFRGNAILCSES